VQVLPNGSIPTYERWRESVFPEGTPEGDRAMDADPDSDGQSNFMEYAACQDPNATTVEIFGRTFFETNSQSAEADQLLSTSFRARADPQLRYIIEYGDHPDDMFAVEIYFDRIKQTWRSTHEVIEINGSNLDPDGCWTVHISGRRAGDEAFMRLRVELASSN